MCMCAVITIMVTVHAKRPYKSAKKFFNYAALCINRPMRLFAENLKATAQFIAEIQLWLLNKLLAQNGNFSTYKTIFRILVRYT